MSARARATAPALALVLLALAGRYGPPLSRQGAAADTVTTVAYDVGGVRVIQRRMPGSELVAVRLYLLGGVRQLTAETAGVEALLLRAIEMDRGSAIARAGGRSTGTEGVDWSMTGCISLRQDFDSAWTAFTDWLVDPRPSDDAIFRAKAELVSAARQRFSDPDLRIRALAQRAMFPDHPYDIDVLGTEQTLLSLTRTDLERYAAAQFVTSRMLLVVVGALSREEMEPRVAATLGRLPRGAYRWTLPPPVARRKTAAVLEHRSLPTNYLLGYFAGPPPTHADYYAFELATHALSARLTLVLRNRWSLSYAPSALFLDHAIPIGGIYASTQQPALVYGVIQDEIAGLQAWELHPESLRHFVRQFTLDALGQYMTTDGQAEALGRAELYFGDYRRADDYLPRLRRVRPSDVRRAAIKYMQHIQFAYLGDTTALKIRR